MIGNKCVNDSYQTEGVKNTRKKRGLTAAAETT